MEFAKEGKKRATSANSKINKANEDKNSIKSCFKSVSNEMDPDNDRFSELSLEVLDSQHPLTVPLSFISEKNNLSKYKIYLILRF